MDGLATLTGSTTKGEYSGGFLKTRFTPARGRKSFSPILGVVQNEFILEKGNEESM